jgi:hypothetical protein
VRHGGLWIDPQEEGIRTSLVVIPATQIVLQTVFVNLAVEILAGFQRSIADDVQEFGGTVATKLISANREWESRPRLSG